MLSIILATKGNPHQAIKVVNNLLATTIGEYIDSEVIVVSPDEGITEFIRSKVEIYYDFGRHKRILFVCENKLNRMDAWNFGASLAKGKYIHGSADDLVYPKGWAASTIQRIEEDGRDDIYCRIPCQLDCYWAETGIGTRDFFKKHMGGCIVVPHYKAIYTDVEMSDRAIGAGVLIRNDNTKIEHLWNGPAPAQIQHHDHDLYLLRKSKNFPNDFEAMIK